jgi:hypothetical protein
LIGASPFDLSLVDSSISTTINKAGSVENDNALPAADTTMTILQMAADDRAEEGDSGDSDVEGGEVNLHYEVMMSVDHRSEEHARLLANDLDEDKWGEVSAPRIPGAPDG